MCFENLYPVPHPCKLKRFDPEQSLTPLDAVFLILETTSIEPQTPSVAYNLLAKCAFMYLRLESPIKTVILESECDGDDRAASGVIVARVVSGVPVRAGDL